MHITPLNDLNQICIYAVHAFNIVMIYIFRKPERFIINCGDTALEKWYLARSG